MNSEDRRKQADELLDKARRMYPAVRQTLGGFPGVVGLGIGFKEIRDQLTTEIAWRVYVKEKKPRNLLRTRDLIPGSISGIRTDVVPKSYSRMTFGEDYREQLVPGIQIRSDFKEDGSLGCFARLKSDNSIVLLSNSHILYGTAHRALDVGQPKVSCCLCCKCKVIGTNVGDGRNAFNNVTVEYAYPDEPGTRITEAGSETDCAIARLNRKRPFTNEIPFIGMIAGTPPAGDFGVAVGSEVEKVGSGSGHTKGIVLKSPMLGQRYQGGPVIPEFLVPVKGSLEEDIGALPMINQIWIMPAPGFPDFVIGGDSGSVVVNNNKQVVGLVTRKQLVNDFAASLFHLPPYVRSLGVVNPINKVLTALNIEIPANFSSTSPIHGELMEADALCEEERRFQEKIKALQAEVRATPLGRYAFERLEMHQDEVARLFNQNRRVAVTWRRHKGPAFAAHCFKSFQSADHLVPRQIEGVSRSSLILEMAEVLKMYGSESLKKIIETELPRTLQWIDEFDSLNSMLTFLRSQKHE